MNKIVHDHEQVIIVDRAKKLSDAELIIKLASSSVGECIFRDLRVEIYISSEEKTSSNGEINGRLIALKQVDFTILDISKYFMIAASYF